MKMNGKWKMPAKSTGPLLHASVFRATMQRLPRCVGCYIAAAGATTDLPRPVSVTTEIFPLISSFCRAAFACGMPCLGPAAPAAEDKRGTIWGVGSVG